MSKKDNSRSETGHLDRRMCSVQKKLPDQDTGASHERGSKHERRSVDAIRDAVHKQDRVPAQKQSARVSLWSMDHEE